MEGDRAKENPIKRSKFFPNEDSILSQFFFCFLLTNQV